MKRLIRIWVSAFLLALSALFFGGGAWGAPAVPVRTGVVRIQTTVSGVPWGFGR